MIHFLLHLFFGNLIVMIVSIKFSMASKFIALAGLLGAVGLPLAAARHYNQKKFLRCLKREHDQIWAVQLDEKAQIAKSEFEKKIRLPTGEIYGDSVRRLKIAGKTICQLENELSRLECGKHTNVLRDPSTKEAVKTPYGKTIPIWIYLCSDGGVVRIKPNGDLVSRYIPYPNVTKGLRHPYNAHFNSFDDEKVKVDDQGYAIPKWPADLNREGACGLDWRDFVDGWAADAHARIRSGC